MARVIWTKRGLTTLKSAIAYIEAENPAAAERLESLLLAAADSLASNPERGRLAGRGGRRELVIVRPYLIGYRVSKDDVEITYVRHGARRPF